MILTALVLALLAAEPAAGGGPSRFAPVEIKVFQGGQAFVLFEGRVVPEGGLRVPLDFVRKGEWRNLRVWTLDGSPLKMLTLQPRDQGRKAAQARRALEEAVGDDPDLVPASLVEADHTAVLNEPVQRVHLKASILTSRFRWAPQYRLSLEGDGALDLDLEASVTNNLEDLDSVPVHFLSSELCQPPLGWADPAAYGGSSVETPPEDAGLPQAGQGCGCQFAASGYPGMPYYGVAMPPQAFLLETPELQVPPESQPQAAAPSVAGPLDAEEDPAELPPVASAATGPFGQVPPVELTLKQGELAKVTVFSRRLEGELAQLWDASGPEAAQPSYQGLLLNNTSDLLLPAGEGSAFLVGSYLGAVCVPAVPVGAQAFIPLGPSPALRGNLSETVKSSRILESGDNLFDEQHLQGRVTLTNVSPREITVLVRRVVSAKAVSSRDFAVRALSGPGDTYHTLQAKVTIPARSARTLKYTLERILPAVR